MGLERAQEIENLLLLRGVVVEKLLFDRAGLTAMASVILNGVDQVGSAAVVQQKDSLSQPPQGRCTELIAPGPSLRHVVADRATCGGKQGGARRDCAGRDRLPI